MKKKIFLYYIILTVIAVSVTVFFTSQTAQKYYKSEVRDKLVNSAMFIGSQISDELGKGQKVDYDAYAKKYSHILEQSSRSFNPDIKNKTRITIIDSDGKVLGESETDYSSMENHQNRKEVKDALGGSIGEDTRYSETLHIDFLYVSVPVKNAPIVVRASVPLVQLQNIDQIMWYYSIVGILIGLFITSLLALRFSGSITMPIKELTRVSKEISTGNYAKRSNINSHDEIGELANAFNDMASELERTVADLTEKNVRVDTIINSMSSGIVAVDHNYMIILANSIACELFGVKNGPGIVGLNVIELIRNTQINAQLKETIDKNIFLAKDIFAGLPHEKILRVHTSPIKSKHSSSKNSGGIIYIQNITSIKKLEQIRTDFVSNVTHELKTPLTSIRGFIETLRAGALKDQNVAEKFLEIIDIEAERLSMLINDILQLSEIEGKQKDTNITDSNLKMLIEETMAILQGMADKKNVYLTFEVDEKLNIHANRDRIKQMLINLIENGIKYNTEGGNVNIKAFRSEGKLTISITDTGIGIAAEHLSRIFERFYRVDKGRSRNMGGTGLGLSIVKHIVNLYSGDIKVNSELGKGTEFSVRLPV